MNTRTIDWAIRANDAGFATVMRGVVDSLTGVKRGGEGARTAVNNLGAAANTAAGQWARHRRELETMYTAMGKVPSKEVVAELDRIEKKYHSLAEAAEDGNRAAAGAMRNLMSQARSLTAWDAMADAPGKRGLRGALADQTITAASNSMKLAIAGLSAGLLAAGFANRIREQIDLADALDKSAQRASISAQSMSTMVYAAKSAAVDMDGLSGAMGKLAKSMFDADMGNKRTAATFRALGVEIKDADGKLRASDETLLDLADRFSQMPEGAQKSALAMEVFGKSGASILPFLNMGRKGIERLREEARALGLEISDETAAAAGELNDKLERMRSVSEGIWRQFAAKLIPTLSAAADGLGDTSAKGSMLEASVMAVDGALKGLIITGALVGATLKTTGIIITRVAAASVAAASGEFSQARAILGTMTEDARKAGIEFETYAKKVWTGTSGPAGVPKPKVPVDMDEIRQSGGGTAGAKSRMSAWDNELDQMKLAHQKLTAEQGTFVAFSRERERDFWKAKLDGTQMSAEERFAVEKRYLAALQSLNGEAFAASIAAQKNQMAEMERNHVAQLAIAEDIAERIRKAYGADSKQYADAQRDLQAVQRQALDQRRKLEDLALAEQRSAATQAIALEQQQAQVAYDMGLVNRAQLLTLEVDFQARLHEIKRQALERSRETIDPERDPVAYQQVLNQLLDLERNFQLARSKLGAELSLHETSPIKNTFDSFESAFSQAADGMLNRAQSWRQSMAGLFASVGSTFVQEVAVKPTARYIAQLGQRLLATQSTTAAETSMEAVAAGAKTGISFGASTAMVANNAVVAASGAAASQAPIPFVGPALAAAAMVATLALVMGLGSSMRSARGGFDIPAGINPLTQLHEEEMVLPARYANVIRQMAGQQGEGAAGGDGSEVFQFNPVIQAMDARGVDRVLEAHGHKFIAYLKDHKRKLG
ncbi:hypothetical protein [Cupriavidus malaysiensis]|uniref:Uncharacterized protein n=1 Tax=Cupriavidus malaysiensis TaxID=367825 RepID=A0ABN4TGV3_9BURK|nr:hypothetical protein [Cupriavidus malaysiensis]AOZ05966.1 hypothetical protein BKK80_09090 [Cupriavidus malaysiensis]